MRRKVIAGNWKMNMLPNEAIEFITNLAPMVKEITNEYFNIYTSDAQMERSQEIVENRIEF